MLGLLLARATSNMMTSGKPFQIARSNKLSPRSFNSLVQFIEKRDRASSEERLGTRAVVGEHLVGRMRSRHAGDRILLFIQIVFAPRQYLSMEDIQDEKLIGRRFHEDGDSDQHEHGVQPLVGGLKIQFNVGV